MHATENNLCYAQRLTVITCNSPDPWSPARRLSWHPTRLFVIFTSTPQHFKSDCMMSASPSLGRSLHGLSPIIIRSVHVMSWHRDIWQPVETVHYRFGRTWRSTMWAVVHMRNADLEIDWRHTQLWEVTLSLGSLFFFWGFDSGTA
jgi:hypothetical protein